jgi:uncharacterized phiE125 gp8 family phage protein
MQFELTPFDLPEGYGESIVPLAAMKQHLALIEDDQDALVEVYRDAAIDMVERYCGVRLAPLDDVTVRFESLPASVRLGVWPVTAINSITWLSDAAAAVIGEESDWRIVRRDEITLKPGKVLPERVAAGIEIKFDAGFTDANRPAALVQAVKLFAAHLFLNREAVTGGTVAGEIPLGFKVLCAQYRVPVI